MHHISLSCDFLFCYNTASGTVGSRDSSGLWQCSAIFCDPVLLCQGQHYRRQPWQSRPVPVFCCDTARAVVVMQLWQFRPALVLLWQCQQCCDQSWQSRAVPISCCDTTSAVTAMLSWQSRPVPMFCCDMASAAVDSRDSPGLCPGSAVFCAHVLLWNGQRCRGQSWQSRPVPMFWYVLCPCSAATRAALPWTRRDSPGLCPCSVVFCCVLCPCSAVTLPALPRPMVPIQKEGTRPRLPIPWLYQHCLCQRWKS